MQKPADWTKCDSSGLHWIAESSGLQDVCDNVEIGVFDNQLYEDVFDNVEIDEEVDYNATVDNEVHGTAAFHNWRDNIAQSMWNNYTNAPAN